MGSSVIVSPAHACTPVPVPAREADPPPSTRPVRHLLASAGWNGDDRVRCSCGTWSCEPTGPGDTPTALGQYLDHVTSAELADRDTPPVESDHETA